MLEPAAGAERTYTVGLAQAALDGLFRELPLGEALNRSWVPAATVTRYGRRWYLSRLIDIRDDHWYGRIGFVRRGVVPTLFFDVENADFVTGEAPSGTIVPFVISTDTGLIAYQLRSDVVTERTFIGALRDLLNLNGAYAWDIRPLVEGADYQTWIAGMSRVTEFHFKLERPNPHYGDDEIAERIIEGFKLEYAVLSGVAREGEGIDTESSVFRQALDYVLRDYGRVTLTALDQQGRESLWVKTKRQVGAVTSRLRIRAVGGDEATMSVLAEALERSPADALAAELGDDDEPTS
jgi:hypothetical protein